MFAANMRMEYYCNSDIVGFIPTLVRVHENWAPHPADPLQTNSSFVAFFSREMQHGSNFDLQAYFINPNILINSSFIILSR